jgi:hypothetical protein
LAAAGPAATMLVSSPKRGGSEPVRVVVAGRHAELAGWPQARGLAANRQLVPMVQCGPLAGDQARLFAPGSVAIV